MYETRDGLKAAGGACTQLFSNLLGKIKEIDRFKAPIESTLGIKIHALGVGDEFKHTTAKLVLLDYYLGTEKTKKAMQAAVRKTKEIYDAYPPGGMKPLIVLMSSVREVAAHKEEFRSLSNLLGGMFDFVPKEDLAITERPVLEARNLGDGPARGV